MPFFAEDKQKKQILKKDQYQDFFPVPLTGIDEYEGTFETADRTLLRIMKDPALQEAE